MFWRHSTSKISRCQSICVVVVKRLSPKLAKDGKRNNAASQVVYNEAMSAVKRINPREIFSPAQLQRLGRVSSWRGLSLVAHAWLVIGLTLVVCTIVSHPLLWLAAVPIIGGRQLGLAILMHDAAHGLLHPDRRINDFVGRWLCGEPIGAGLNSYRHYHFQHHKFTQQPEDPDLALSAPFPISRGSLWRKIIRDLTGQTFYKQRMAVAAGPLGKTVARTEAEVTDARRDSRRFLVGSIVVFLICAALGLAGLFIAWALALMTWFQLAIRVRNIAEHACTNTDTDPFSHARTTQANWFERALLAPYRVNYHAEHHLFAWLPCYRLPEVHQLLQTQGHAGRMTIAPNYWHVLQQLTRAQKSA